jgi:serine/threonine protein kinase
MPEHDKIETSLRPGIVVGAHYRVDRLIAKGGMAAVWAGSNVHTGKRVALKIMLQSFASNGDAVELFRREALSASSINHPNVVNIFDVIDHQGMTCIVMELFDGETLGSYLTRNGPLSLEKTLTLLLPAMRGVAAANAQGVVHCDLKPANLFLCSNREGQLITTKVLDFGISVMMRGIGDPAPEPERLAMFGTPAYMAPEAIALSPNIDGRADVYGFGVLFFETLTGKLPFPGPPGQELMERILTVPPPLVTRYRPDLPPDVVNLIACALAKKPEDRFPDMEHLVHAAEDRLLPLLSMSRSLMPMSGIVLLPPVGSNADTAAVPIVQAIFDKEPSDCAHMSDTRGLHSMANKPLPASHGMGLSKRRRPWSASAGNQTEREQVSRTGARRFFSRRVASGAALVAFSMVTAWVSAPKSSSGSDKGHGQAPGSFQLALTRLRPVLTPLPSTPDPPPLPGGALDNLAAVPNIPGPEIHAAAPHASRPRHRAKSRAHEPLRVDVRTGPRAGRLSPSDF